MLFIAVYIIKLILLATLANGAVEHRGECYFYDLQFAALYPDITVAHCEFLMEIFAFQLNC